MFSFDSQSKVLSGIPIPPFFHPNVTIGQVIMHYLQREPAKVVQACYDDGVELTAGEMAKLASRIAKNLSSEGFKVGEVVGLVAKNTTYVAPVVLGCMLVGCPVSTLDPTFDSNEVANIFKQTKPKLVFCDHDNFETVTEALQDCGNECEVITVDEILPGSLSIESFKR
jgi:4-coumarate--CoA ligase